MKDDPDLLRRELARQKAARLEAERLLEEKSLEVYERNRALEHQIEERLRIEAQLREKAEQLARTNLELEQFAYVASHDLKAPLRSIAGFSQLLTRRYGEQLDQDGREFLAFIESGVRRMQTLIEDLLEYARASRVKLSPDWVESRMLVESVCRNLKTTLDRSGAQVRLGELPKIFCDAQQLTLVFQNLIDNAVKFQHPGALPVVDVQCTSSPESWVFRVSDNGIGIPHEYADKVFMLFQRLHDEDRYEGTGLGLPICRKIVERHGGVMYIQPVEGPGTCFTFTLARQRSQEGE